MNRTGQLARSASIQHAAAALLAGLTLATSAGAASGNEPAAGWQRDCPGGAFCFSRPATLVAQPGQVIDSLAGSYSGQGVSLSFDLGRYGHSVDHLVNPARQSLTIDGRPAEMLTGANEVVLVVPKVHATALGNVQLHMALKADAKASRELALRIFQSIEFKPPR